MPSFNVNKYSVRIFSSRDKVEPFSPAAALSMIQVYYGSTLRGNIYFYPDGTELADPSYDSTYGRVTLRFNHSDFQATVDLLRNEDPVYIFYYAVSNAGLQTGTEPVGEGE